MKKTYILQRMNKNIINNIKVLFVNCGYNKNQLFNLTNKSIKINEQLHSIKDLFFFIEIQDNDIVLTLLTRGNILYKHNLNKSKLEKIENFLNKNKEFVHI